jgi:hypothetical protein
MSFRNAGRGSLLRPYQARILLSLAQGIEAYRGETLTVLLPRQAGKNQVAAALVSMLLRANAARGGSIVVCAPTLTPQAEISRQRTLAALHETAHLVPGAGENSDARTITCGKASATFLSGSPLAHVAGHTASIVLIADEAQDIDEEWFDRQFRPMAASTGAPTVLFGTPWDGETLLDRAVARNRLRDSLERGIPYVDFLPRHHEAGWRTVAASLPAYGQYVRAERERLGAMHPLFLTQYGLQCVADAGRLLSSEDLARMEGVHVHETAPTRGYRYVAGLDVGGEGAKSDASVLTIARVRDRTCEVVTHVAWNGEAESAIGPVVAGLAAKWGLERICVDATGIGQPLARDLERDLGSRVEPVHFNAATKSELGYALIAAARNGRVTLYRDDGSLESRACRAEIAACRARLSGGALRWEAPSGGHDDYAVSLALCLRAAESLGAPRVALGRRR